MAVATGDIHAALGAVMDTDHGRLLAALIGLLDDFQLAEDVLSDAMEAALVHWRRSGLPDNPQGWLLKVARRRAIDRIRRRRTETRHSAELSLLMERDTGPEPPEIPDDRLRLIFTCCHPALEEKTRVALTLRTIGGLTTQEIARAFLDRDAAMGQRLSRARAKIAAARIPYAVPDGPEWDARLASVLTVIYLIYNAGYSASGRQGAVRRDLCEEAIWLARLLRGLCPGLAELEGLLALMLLTHGRAGARLDPQGASLSVAAQDVAAWDHAMLREGLELLDHAVARGTPGPCQIKAAIAACHVEARLHDAPTDWRQILLLYDRLNEMEPTPVVALNRAVALAEMSGPTAALGALEPLADALAGYQPFHAARAHFLARSGQARQARAAFDQALEMTDNSGYRRFLMRARAALPD